MHLHYVLKEGGYFCKKTRRVFLSKSYQKLIRGQISEIEFSKGFFFLIKSSSNISHNFLFSSIFSSLLLFFLIIEHIDEMVKVFLALTNFLEFEP